MRRPVKDATAKVQKTLDQLLQLEQRALIAENVRDNLKDRLKTLENLNRREGQGNPRERPNDPGASCGPE